MNRNTEAYFSELPKVDVQRSIFDYSHGHKTSFNVGDVVPITWFEVLAGDTFKLSVSSVTRLQTLLTPIMDNVYMDVYAFYTPMRLVFGSTKEFFGENTQGPWFPQTEKTIPIIRPPETGWNIGTVADHLGIPPGLTPFHSDGSLRPDSDFPSALPFRVYAMICNEWFRNQNVSDPLQIPIGDATQQGSNGNNYITDTVNGGALFKARKFPDYFTASLPSPQKGPSVELSLGPNAVGTVTTDDFDYSGQSIPWATPRQPIYWAYTNQPSTARRTAINTNNNQVSAPVGEPGTGFAEMYPVNLIANMNGVDLVSVNQLRLAFQLQKFYEKNARGGTRMREVLHEHFGVTTPDARMMIPEYLGGHRFPLQIHQVTNTTQGVSDFLGDLGGMSNTADHNDCFVRSFTEPGYIMIVAVARYDHSYTQGLHRAWSRRTLTDFYFPVFAHIGEKPVYKREIYAIGDDAHEVFGYQEAWAEYRYFPDTISGELRSGHDRTLDSWHLGDYYTESPTLSDGWIREDPANVDRVLAVTSSVSNQVFADFRFNCTATRPMPVHSIPGLIDHF